jgi:hypothetical protein
MGGDLHHAVEGTSGLGPGIGRDPGADGQDRDQRGHPDGSATSPLSEVSFECRPRHC